MKYRLARSFVTVYYYAVAAVSDFFLFGELVGNEHKICYQVPVLEV